MQRLRVGDRVQVISGSDAGKQGTVTKLIKDEDRAVVEGINLKTKHQKPNAKNQQGGKTTMEAPLHVSKLMLLDPETGKPTRVRFQEQDGKKVRIAKSGAVIEAGK